MLFVVLLVPFLLLGGVAIIPLAAGAEDASDWLKSPESCQDWLKKSNSEKHSLAKQGMTNTPSFGYNPTLDSCILESVADVSDEVDRACRAGASLFNAVPQSSGVWSIVCGQVMYVVDAGKPPVKRKDVRRVWNQCMEQVGHAGRCQDKLLGHYLSDSEITELVKRYKSNPARVPPSIRNQL